MAKERTVTIELDYPVQLPDGELKRLVMHRPSVKEVMDNPIRDALDIAGESRINVFDILKYNTVIATKAAVANIEEVYA